MTIPTDAVYYEGGKPMVYTLQDNKVHETPIAVGIYDSEKSEVTEGLTDSDQVIVTWSSELFEGSEVEIYDGGSTAGAEESSAADAAVEIEESAGAK